jgi:hypothetical protein
MYSGKRLEVTTLLGEGLSDTSPSGDLTFSLIFIDSFIPQPLLSSQESIAIKIKIKIDEAFVFFVGTFFRRNSNEI